MKKQLTALGVGTVILLGFLAIVHFSTIAHGAQNATPTFATSRFMLFSGNYQLDSGLKNSNGTTVSGVFRIDTYTGETWMLKVIKTQAGASIEHWQLIPKPQVK
jgi:hypothetical protein